MNQRRQISQAVQTRLRKGETKESIYNDLKEKWPASAVERSLAQWPLKVDRDAGQKRNLPLLLVSVFFALLTVLTNAPKLSSFGPQQLASLAIVLIIQLYTIYGVLNYNLIGYMLTVLISLRHMMDVFSVGISDPRHAMLLAMSAVAIFLAWSQKVRLFPNTSILLHHKKNPDGSIIF